MKLQVVKASNRFLSTSKTYVKNFEPVRPSRSRLKNVSVKIVRKRERLRALARFGTTFARLNLRARWESLTQLSTTIGHGLTNFAATNLKGTNLPARAPVAPEPVQHKMLPHALGCAATTTAQALQSTGTGPDRKTTTYQAGVWDSDDLHALPASLEGDTHQLDGGHAQGVAGGLRIAARTPHGEVGIQDRGPARQEQSRLEVENAEDDVLQKTGVAIMLMKVALENPEHLKNLNEFVGLNSPTTRHLQRAHRPVHLPVAYRQLRLAPISLAGAARPAPKAKRKVIFKCAESYVKSYVSKEKEEVRLKRSARAVGDFYVPAEPKVYLVVRIRGINEIAPKPHKILPAPDQQRCFRKGHEGDAADAPSRRALRCLRVRNPSLLRGRGALGYSGLPNLFPPFCN
ncbi:ribosomal L30 N-terminal domain-containing protein [Phellopilus nigrolimitatus]|nr:ribosomal L30 N-terminal domain-containing protein [Phellopilus nigrolimitatus]